MLDLVNWFKSLIPKKTHKYKVGDLVVFTNTFGVCWGIKKVVGLDSRCDSPTYYIEPTDSPWFSTDESHLSLATKEDLIMNTKPLIERMTYFQNKYGFTPTDYFGCY